MRRVRVALLCCFIVDCAPRLLPQPGPTSSRELSGLHFDIGAIDPRVSPCADFYDFACGGWRAAHPIPPDQTRWDRYAEMAAVNLDRARTIVEESARSGAASTPAEQRIGAYYSACMDEKEIDTRGVGSAGNIVAAIDAIRSSHDATILLAQFQAHDIQALIGAYAETDPRDAATTVLWLDKGFLGLPDPADYEKSDEAAVKLRGRYVAHLVRIFQLLGASQTEANTSAARTLSFESKLAKNALSMVDRRNHDLQVHPMSMADLVTRYGAIDWPAYFRTLGLAEPKQVNVAQPMWLDGLNTALASDDLAPFRDYLRVMLARAMASVLPSALENEVFDFRQRTLRGAREMAARSTRCLKRLDSDLGDEVGRLFVARYYPAEARARMGRMTDALISAFRADLGSIEWLGAPARAAAIGKLSKMLLVTGASNRLRSFEGLRIERDDAFGNAWRAQALRYADSMTTVGKPTDRERFFEALPQELDGFGSKSKNATGFTAGFLQPPIFDPRLDDAVNFGGLGSVIGHELTHQFDDEGRKFDGDGNLSNWWSKDDVARFQERAQCFVDEYSKFTTDEGTPINGRLTLGENIADNGGLRLSYSALHPSEVGPRLDGYTPAQRFFLAWAQIRCENVTPERAKRQAQNDPHSPGRWRVNGVVSNMPEFASAFACEAGAPMAPEHRCHLW